MNFSPVKIPKYSFVKVDVELRERNFDSLAVKRRLYFFGRFKFDRPIIRGCAPRTKRKLQGAFSVFGHHDLGARLQKYLSR